MVRVSEGEPATADERERGSLESIEELLDHEDVSVVVRAVDRTQSIELPETAIRLLRDLVHHLARGRAVSVAPIVEVMPTQEAADYLHVSRPYLVKLLEQGAIPFEKTGTHRRVRFNDVKSYREQRQALAKLTELCQEIGLYDVPVDYVDLDEEE
ncbi:MAG: excisionase family DNA-binding protein [Dehalococcoidia bacterium]